jgi:hypothetical protein
VVVARSHVDPLNIVPIGPPCAGRRTHAELLTSLRGGLGLKPVPGRRMLRKEAD